MTRTVHGLFDNYDDAANAVNDLEVAGIPHSDITIVANNVSGRHGDHESNAGVGAGTGAAVGVLGGGAVGLLAGLGMLAIPGVGPVVAAGWLIATAAGAAVGAGVGAAGGGLLGALTDSGVPERDAHVYAEGVRRGGTLVSVRAEDQQAALAESILDRFSRADVTNRHQAYSQTGWERFDQTAKPYTQAEIEQNRTVLPPR